MRLSLYELKAFKSISLPSQSLQTKSSKQQFLITQLAVSTSRQTQYAMSQGCLYISPDTICHVTGMYLPLTRHNMPCHWDVSTSRQTQYAMSQGCLYLSPDTICHVPGLSLPPARHNMPCHWDVSTSHQTQLPFPRTVSTSHQTQYAMSLGCIYLSPDTICHVTGMYLPLIRHNMPCHWAVSTSHQTQYAMSQGCLYLSPDTICHVPGLSLPPARHNMPCHWDVSTSHQTQYVMSHDCLYLSSDTICHVPGLSPPLTRHNYLFPGQYLPLNRHNMPCHWDVSTSHQTQYGMSLGCLYLSSFHMPNTVSFICVIRMLHSH